MKPTRPRPTARGRLAALLVTTATLLCASAVARAQGAALALPEPAVPPPAAVEESGESPVYYRMAPDVFAGVARTAFGASWKSDIGEGQSGWGFSLDVCLGAEIGFGRDSRTALLFEGGYAYAYEGEHLFSAGAGLVVRDFGPTSQMSHEVGRRTGALNVALVPHVVVGTLGGEQAYGLRSSLLFTYWLYGVVVSHQWTRVGDRDVHEVQLAVTFYWRMERR